MKTLIIDYGMGNLHSVKNAFDYIGEDAYISSDIKEMEKADALLLPGVGAYGDAAQKLRQSGLDRVVTEQAATGKPLMGICLGMQLLFEKSFEYGEHAGLGLLKGQVVSMEGRLPEGLKIPHMGWNSLTITQADSKLFANTANTEYVYFVHSFFAVGCEDSLAAVTEYGIPITAAVEKDTIFGCQFHPEKSGEAGLKILRAFAGIAGV